MDIRLIAIDLDGTTLNSKGLLSECNRRAIEAAIQIGVDVVPTSGRAYNSLPEEVMNIPGLKYAISSNGAHVTDLRTGEYIYSSYLEPEAVEEAVRLAQSEHLTMEIFWRGCPYINRAVYEKIRETGSCYRNANYVLTTRVPIDDVCDFLLDHRSEIENINFCFDDLDLREQLRPRIEAIPNTHVTSSFISNIEMGGAHSTKAEALQFLTRRLGYTGDQVMSFGDAANDIPMIEYAGIGVAVGNAWDEVKQHADCVSESNDDDGVGKTIWKYILRNDDRDQSL